MGQTFSGQSGQDNPYGDDSQVFIPNIGDPIYGDGRPPMQRKTFKHPVAVLFHVIFKFTAFVFYLFGGLFGQDFISTFVAIILLISMDFWVVKNVTGRLLAGLRWSNYIDDVGNSHWIFENKNVARDQEAQDGGLASFQEELRGHEGTADSSIFWSALIIAPMLWLLLMLVSIFRLNVQWFMLVALASVLSLSNLYGYIRCRLGTSDIKSSVTQFVAKQVFYNFITGGSSSSKPVV